jgi:hypothetical protein
MEDAMLTTKLYTLVSNSFVRGELMVADHRLRPPRDREIVVIEKRINLCKARIALQRELVATLSEHRMSSASANRLLLTLLETQALFEHHRKLVQCGGPALKLKTCSPISD